MNPLYSRSVRMGIVILVCVSATKAVPLGTAFTYQGQLKKNGAPIDGTAHLRFSLWDAAGSGSPPVGGSQIGVGQLLANVAVSNGLFTVPLNAGGQFGASAFAGEARWLQIEVCADAGCGTITILAPRQPLTAAPHALFAVSADRLDGLDSTAFLQSIPSPLTLSGPSATHVIRGENASTTVASSGVSGLSTAATGRTYGLFGQSDSTSGRGVFGVATAPTGATYGGWFQTASTSGDGVVGQATASAGVNYGVVGESFSTSGTGVLGYNNVATTGETYGGRFECRSTAGTGVSGSSSAPTGNTIGVFGQSYSPTGRGVYGEVAFLNDTDQGALGGSAGSSDSAVGVFGIARAPTGINYGVYGRSDSTSDDAAGVVGEAGAGVGATYGGRFQSFSPIGTGVYGNGADGVSGESNAMNGNGVVGECNNGAFAYGVLGTTNTGYGVYGVSQSTSGRGVVGVGNADTGATYGVYGLSYSPSGRGVYGEASIGSGSAYGGEFRTGSTSGRGVFGFASAVTGFTNGGWFQTASNSGNGVVGQATNGAGVTHGVIGENFSTSGRGVLGVARASSGITYGVFGHLADGNIHVEVHGPAPDDDAVDVAVLECIARYGGSISAEHGVGRAKAGKLHLCRSAAEIDAMRAIKRAWDPQGIMNPGVIFSS